MKITKTNIAKFLDKRHTLNAKVWRTAWGIISIDLLHWLDAIGVSARAAPRGWRKLCVSHAVAQMTIMSAVLPLPERHTPESAPPPLHHRITAQAWRVEECPGGLFNSGSVFRGLVELGHMTRMGSVPNGLVLRSQGERVLFYADQWHRLNACGEYLGIKCWAIPQEVEL